MNHSRPQTRQIRERKQADDSPQLRFIRVREQSAFVSSPRQQTRQQSVRIRDQGAVSIIRDKVQAANTDTPHTARIRRLAIATASPLTGIGRESEQAANCPDHCIAVVFSSLIHFPVHIRRISHNVLV